MKKGPGAKDDKGEKKGKEDEDDMGYRLTTSDFVKQLKAADKTYVGKNIDYLHFCVCMYYDVQNLFPFLFMSVQSAVPCDIFRMFIRNLLFDSISLFLFKKLF